MHFLCSFNAKSILKKKKKKENLNILANLDVLVSNWAALLGENDLLWSPETTLSITKVRWKFGCINIRVFSPLFSSYFAYQNSKLERKM